MPNPVVPVHNLHNPEAHLTINDPDDTSESRPTRLEEALSLAARGWPVFPGHLTDDDPPKKVPANAKGFKGATVKPRPIEIQWRSDPDAYVAVALPIGVVALDVDKVEQFEAAGLEMPDGPGQRTLHGGYHKLFKTDGRVVKQTVKEIPGADTRVGGLGYVFVWDAAAWPDVAESLDALPDAPEWLYDHEAREEVAPSERRTRGGAVPTFVFKMGERDNALAAFAGLMRRGGAGPDAIYAALKAMADSGQIEQTREDQITDKDLRRIAGSIGGRQSNAVDAQSRPRRAIARQNAEELKKKQIIPIEYVIEEVMPEGVGIISGAPKIGKSWLAFQAALEVSVGGELLGRKVLKARPALYYGLEDGERRFQKRMQMIEGSRGLDLSWLELRYDAPAIGDGLEEEIEEFIANNEEYGGSVVVIDVLAKVWPEQQGRGSAYNQDYRVIGPLKEIQGRHPGSTIVCITHNRKQGAEDVMSTVQGTHGVVGAVDWTWIIKRERLAVQGNIYVTGRDIEHEPSIDAQFAGLWTALPGAGGQHLTPEQRKVRDELLTGEDGTATEVADRLNVEFPDDAPRWTQNSVSEKANALEAKGLVTKERDRTRPGAPVVFHALVTDEIAERRRGVAAEQAKVLASQPGRGPRVVRRSRRPEDGDGSRARARDRARRPAREVAPSTTSIGDIGVMVAVEGVEGGLRAPGPARPRVRAPAHTRTRVELDDRANEEGPDA